MLLDVKNLIAELETPETDNDFASPLPDTSRDHQGYLKYGFYSRKTYFYFSYYKAFNLEAFKADEANAHILADILSNLFSRYLLHPSSWTIFTTPKRAHTEKLGYHFASEVLKITADKCGIVFLADVFSARDKDKVNPVFNQLLPLPESKVILFDDILTTGRTLFTCLELIKSNPQNKCTSVDIPVIAAINNN